MKLPTSNNNANAKQLLFKKNIIVKFRPLNYIGKEGSAINTSDIQTTTGGTFPTTSIIIYTIGA